MLKKEEKKKKNIHAKKHERKKCMPKSMKKRKEKKKKERNKDIPYFQIKAFIQKRKIHDSKEYQKTFRIRNIIKIPHTCT